MQILIVQFAFAVPLAEFERIAADAAPAYAGVPGLLSKTWILNDTTHEAGGVYVFADAEALDAFLSGPLAAAMRDAPFVRDLRVRRYATMPELTALTRGPVAGPALRAA